MKKYLLNKIIIHSIPFHNIYGSLEKILLYSENCELITTFNLDFLRIADSDPDFFKICNETLYNFPDGFGITSLIRIKYKEKIERITGNDLFPILLRLTNKHDLRLAIIGGTKKVSQNVNAKILSKYEIKGKNLICLSPSYRFEKDITKNNQVIKEVIKFNPDIVLAAMGCPRQEKWLFENMNKFGSKINIGIGATLDYFSEEKKRSPLLLQKLGFEWLWRLFIEPKRLFRRYIIEDIPFYIKMILKTIFGKDGTE